MPATSSTIACAGSITAVCRRWRRGPAPSRWVPPRSCKTASARSALVSVSASGLSQIVNVSITFKGAFVGLKNIYMFASEGAVNTGWVQRGTYLVAAGGIPVANSVVPSAGSGPSQRFSFTVSDQGGSGFIVAVAMLFSPTLDTNNACSLVYDRTRNTISLAFDNPANGAASVVPGSSTVVSNHQCTLRGANSTVVAGTTSLVVTVDIAFNATFFGAKNTYLYAAESLTNSGWVTVGGWTVTGGAPTADSVSPASGSGSSPNFTFTASDSASQSEHRRHDHAGHRRIARQSGQRVLSALQPHHVDHRPLRRRRRHAQHERNRIRDQPAKQPVRGRLYGHDHVRQLRLVHHQSWCSNRRPSAAPKPSTCRLWNRTRVPVGYRAEPGPCPKRQAGSVDRRVRAAAARCVAPAGGVP